MFNPLMNILYIEHKRDNKIIFKQENVHNMIHLDGENFILSSVFVSPSSISNFYLGLDNRTNILANDEMDNIVGEPIGNGYNRAILSSVGDFVMEQPTPTDHWRAKSPIVSFSANSSGYGPVKHLFLTTSSGSGGQLISTSSLESSLSLVNGDQITLRITLALKFCP